LAPRGAESGGGRGGGGRAPTSRRRAGTRRFQTARRHCDGALKLALVLAFAAWASWAAGAAAKPFDPNAPKKTQAQGPVTFPKGGPAIPKLLRRVVMISLDGAGWETLQQMWRDDQLEEGGFARFFREGQASALAPVEPTVTAPNHASLATGVAPDHTGIVGNRFHPAAAPPFKIVSGFEYPNGAETLWEAARRQKLPAAVLAWPGADGTSPRRRGDLGTTWVSAPERQAQIVVIQRSEWHAAAPAPPKLASRSPVLTAHVTLPGSGAIGPASFDLFAVDRTDDGTENYDGVAFTASPAAAAGEAAAGTSHANPPIPGGDLQPDDLLRQGGWAEITFPDHGGRSTIDVKVLAMDPGLDTVRIYFGGSYRLQAHPPDLAAQLAAAGLAWPGPPDDRRLAAAERGEEGIDADTWADQAANFAAFLGGAMRVVAARQDWQLMMGYFPVIDEAGHEMLLANPHQEGYSEARRDELARARRKVWQAVDRELRLLLAALDLGRTTVVVVSDHGMTPVHTAIDLNALLRERGLLASPPSAGQATSPPPADQATGASVPEKEAAATGGLGFYAVGNSGMAHLYLPPPLSGVAGVAEDNAAARQKLLVELRDQLIAWRVGDDTPIERVLTRQEAADLGLDHPNSGDLIVFAREGYSFDSGPEPAGTATTHPAPVRGTHGYLATNPDMQGIYLAIGKDVKPATGARPVSSVDVAVRVAGWLGMDKPHPTAPPESH
jgi:predicted AlkP superfamily pyrophosphatase or phosphodiesterase